MRLVDADKIIYREIDEIGGEYEPYLGCSKSQIDSLPSVTPQPRKGHWIVDGSVDCYLDKARCHCSECGEKKNFPADYNYIKKELSISYKYPELIDNYCSNCGTDMREVEE